jgi:hypothetical protein
MGTLLKLAEYMGVIYFIMFSTLFRCQLMLIFFIVFSNLTIIFIAGLENVE